MHKFIGPSSPPIHLQTQASARANAPSVQLVLMCNDAREIRLCNMLQAATAPCAKRAALCTRRSVTPQWTRMRRSEHGLAMSPSLYCFRARPCVEFCACCVHASREFMHQPLQPAEFVHRWMKEISWPIYWCLNFQQYRWMAYAMEYNNTFSHICLHPELFFFFLLSCQLFAHVFSTVKISSVIFG